MISSEELSQIRKIDKQGKDTLDRIMTQEGEKYGLLYITLLQKLVKIDTVRYNLVLIGDMLLDHDERAKYFHDMSSADNTQHPYSVFAKLLANDDDFIPLKASMVLTTLICSAPDPSSIDVGPLFDWLAGSFNGEDLAQADLAVQELESLLRIRQLRGPFYKVKNGVSGLVNLLNGELSPQMQYQIVFCFWLLTFDEDIAKDINNSHEVIPLLVRVGKAANKEKIQRMIIATFKNLVEKAPEANLPTMLVTQLLPFVKSLSARKWSDDEIAEDLEYLKNELTERFQSLTTFDEYVSELRSGILTWSPPHQSEQFWKQNVTKLNERDYEYLKLLSKILITSKDPVALAVAAHDIGQYVKFYASGKKVVEDIGAKQRVMELMTYDDADVRYQSLLSVQKLLLRA